MEKVDLVIIGAGSAGCAAAYFASQYGYRVLCLERRPMERAGAHWVNAVPARVFPAVGIARPQGAELRGANVPFHLFAGMGPERVTICDHGNLEIDMRLLTKRLRGLAEASGALFLGNIEIKQVTDTEVKTTNGSYQFEWLIDASGLSGCNALQNKGPSKEDICAAAQWVCKITDQRSARAFFETYEVPWGETLCFSGVAGGYSVINVRAEEDELSILTGSIPGDGHPSGQALAKRFIENEPWIGEMIFGGSRAIPLWHHCCRITKGRIAAIGDAASQVYAAHGSGVGLGLMSAYLCVNTLATGGDLFTYEARWNREHGGLLAGANAFRRFSQSLTVDELKTLIKNQILDSELALSGLVQEAPHLSLATALNKVKALMRYPELRQRLQRVLMKMVYYEVMYARFPDSERESALWFEKLKRVDGAPSIKLTNFVSGLR